VGRLGTALVRWAYHYQSWKSGKHDCVRVPDNEGHNSMLPKKRAD